MNELKISPLDPGDPDDIKMIIISICSDIEVINKDVADIRDEVKEIRKSSNRWMPKTLWGWLLLISLTSSLLVGFYEFITVRDNKQETQIQAIITKLNLINKS